MVSLQVFVGQHRNIGIQMQRCRPGSSNQRNHCHREKNPRLARILAPKVAWMCRGLLGQGQKRLKTFRQNSRQFLVKFGTGFVPQTQKSMASSHPTSLCASSFRDCVLTSRTERPSANALCTQGNGRMNKRFWAKNRK